MTDITAVASVPIATPTAAPGTTTKAAGAAATGKVDGAPDPFTALLASLAPAIAATTDADGTTSTAPTTATPVAIPVPIAIATPTKVPALAVPTEEPIVAEHEGDDTGDAPQDGDGKDADKSEDPALAMMLALAPAPPQPNPSISVVQAVITVPVTQAATAASPTVAIIDPGAGASPTPAPKAQDGKAPDAKAAANADPAADGQTVAAAPQTDSRARFASLAARLFASASPTTTAAATDTAQPLPAADATKDIVAKLQPQLAAIRDAAPRDARVATAATTTPELAVAKPKARTASTDAIASIFAAPTAQATTPLQDAGAATTTAAPAGDAAVTRELKVAQDGQWLDTLARDIAATAGKDGQMSFRLDPQHLGSLTVHISHSAEGASIRMTADTESGRAMLADAQPRLVAEARAQGLTLRDTSVDMGGSGTNSQGQHAQSFADLAQGQSQQQRNPAPGQTFVNLNAREADEAARGPDADAKSDLYA
jgi:flagellar hook-length control protein FliK